MRHPAIPSHREHPNNFANIVALDLDGFADHGHSWQALQHHTKTPSLSPALKYGSHRTAGVTISDGKTNVGSSLDAPFPVAWHCDCHLR